LSSQPPPRMINPLKKIVIQKKFTCLCIVPFDLLGHDFTSTVIPRTKASMRWIGSCNHNIFACLREHKKIFLRGTTMKLIFRCYEINHGSIPPVLHP